MAARYAASPTYASVDGTIASQESENRLLELVDDDVMDLGLDTDSDEEVPIFNLEQHLAEFPESEEMLRPIPIRKLHDYWVLFCELDYDCSNQVSASELHECFVMIGIPVDSDELKRMIAETDEDGSGEIDFGEFAHMLFRLHQKMLNEPIEGTEDKQYLIADLGSEPTWLASVRVNCWRFLEDPSSSMLAQVAAAVIIAFILLSCVVFVVESLPSIHQQHDDVFFVIEAVCVTAFTVEYVLRLFSAPNTCAFLFAPLSIVDFVAILPFFLELLLTQYSLSGSAMLRIVRLVRVFRLFKMSRYLGWLVAVTETLRQSLMPLGMIIFVFSIGVIVFSSAEYYLERGEWDEVMQRYVDEDMTESQFQSIPAAFWWCVITMTTVGYGDVVPQSVSGRFFAAGASLTGVLILAIPISVISANFHTEYAKMMKKRGTAAQHRRDLARIQASAVQASTDQESVNKTIIKSSATLLHANSRLMVGNMKHVELSTRGDLVAELTRDVDRMLRKVAWVPADAEVPEAKQAS